MGTSAFDSFDEPFHPGHPACPTCGKYRQVAKQGFLVKEKGLFARRVKVTRWYCSTCRTEWPMASDEEALRGQITDTELDEKPAKKGK